MNRLTVPDGGAEQILQPSPQQAGRAAPSPGNGGQAAGIPVGPSPAPGVAFGQPLGPMVAPMAGTFAQGFAGPMFAPQEGGAVITGPVVDPLYIQASLVAHAWPVQALLESLRRQYGGA